MTTPAKLFPALAPALLLVGAAQAQPPEPTPPGASAAGAQEEIARAAPAEATPTARWDRPFSVKRCERAPTPLPASMEKTLGTVVTITSPDGVGAGYLASPDGFVFTAAHVIGDGEGVKVATYGGPTFPARLVRSDPEHDVALLYVPGEGYPCLVPPAEPAPLGSELYAIGAPGGEKLSHSVTKGIISGRREWESHRFLQTDVALNPGNSGGPLLDTSGRVLGLVSWKVAGAGVEGLSFGIPHEAVVDFLGLAWGDTSGNPDDPGALIALMEVDPAALPPEYLPVIQRPEGAPRLLPPAKPTRRSMAAPLTTLAVGGVLTAGSWLWVQVDPFTTPVEWRMMQGANTAGYGALAVGGIWFLANVGWNHSIQVGLTPRPNGVALGGSVP